MPIDNYRHREDLSYIAVHDTDEIFVPMDFYSVKQFLQSEKVDVATRKYAAVSVNDVTFTHLRSTRYK